MKIMKKAFAITLLFYCVNIKPQSEENEVYSYEDFLKCNNPI